METFSQNAEVLTQRGHVINPKLARKMDRGSCHLKIESKTLKFVHPVQLVVKILKSGTIITLVQKHFLKKEFLNFETSLLVATSLLELSGQNLHLRWVIQLLKIAEGFEH